MQSNQQRKTIIGPENCTVSISEVQIIPINHRNFSGNTKTYDFFYSQSEFSQKLLEDITSMADTSNTSHLKESYSV